jgi:hypothetical protein
MLNLKEFRIIMTSTSIPITDIIIELTKCIILKSLQLHDSNKNRPWIRKAELPRTPREFTRKPFETSVQEGLIFWYFWSKKTKLLVGQEDASFFKAGHNQF